MWHALEVTRERDEGESERVESVSLRERGREGVGGMEGKRQWREEGSEPERYTEGACIGIQVRYASLCC